MQSSEKERDSAWTLRRSSRLRNDLEAIQPRRTRGKRRKYVVESSSTDSSVDSSEDNLEGDVTSIEPASRTTVSTERSSLNPARQLHSSESSVLSVDSCKPSETIKLAEPEQLLMPDSHVKSEPQAHATPIAKLSQQIRSFKKRRRNELDILFTTRGNSDAESRVPSAYQIEAENHDRAKRIKREEGSRSSPLIEGAKTSDHVNKQRSLEYRPGNEQEHLADVSRKHGPSRWRQRTGHPLFCTPDPEENLKGSGQHECSRASVEYRRRNTERLPRQRSEQSRTPAASVITRAQYKDLLARSSQDPINRYKRPFDSSRSLTSSQGSRRRRSTQNKTRPRMDSSDKNLSGGTSSDYPRSWDEATVADRQLVEMRDKGVFWNIVRDTWQDITQRRIAPENLKIRHSYLVSLRNDQSNIPGSAARINDKTDENAAKGQGCPSKFSIPDHNEQIDSSEDDDDFPDEYLGQSSESAESSDLNDQYGEDSEPDGPARAVRGQLSHDGIEQRNCPSASTTVKHVPASERNNRSLPGSNQETATNSACGSPSWKLACRQAKSQNPLEKCYKRSKTVFKGPDLTTENAEPGAAVKALELAASIFKSVSINTDAPKPPEERPPVAARNEIQSIREEPLDEQNAALLLAVEAEVDRRLAPQKHTAIAETMKSKGVGQFSPAVIEQELHRLHQKAKKEHHPFCCAITRTETQQSLTVAHRLETESLETAYATQIARLISSHKAQLAEILDQIRHEARKIRRESTRTGLCSIAPLDTAPL